MMIRYIQIAAAICFGGLVATVGGRNPPKRIVGGIRDFWGMLEKKSSRQGLGNRLADFLTKNGAEFHYGKKITPLKLVIVSLLLFSAGWVVGMKLSIAVSAVAGLLMGALAWILLPMLNRGDNEKMLPDLQSVYHALAVQIKAGVHVSDALSEMYVCVKNNRLRAAFMNLGSDIIMKSDIFSALENFQQKFDNRYIDSLCITILQSMESGQAGDLLSDIGDQMKDMEKAVLEKKKGRLDRSLTFYQLGMLACVLAVALYACVSYMLSQAVSMG